MNYNKDFYNQIEVDYAYKHNIYGRGITVAVLDTGIYSHKDFIYPTNRIIAFKDCISKKAMPYDNHGHGIRVVNISMGTEDSDNKGENATLVRAVDELWNMGLIICVAAGNRGPEKYTITTPGISRKVITFGACDDDKRVMLDNKSTFNYSGRGPTYNSCIIKPEIVSPGSNILSCSNSRDYYAIKSGTSMATPIVSGAIALMLEKNPHLSNKDVKLKLHDSAVDIGIDKNRQGWGMLNIRRLLNV